MDPSKAAYGRKYMCKSYTKKGINIQNIGRTPTTPRLEGTQLKIVTQNNPNFKKWTNEINRYFFKENTQMANRHMKSAQHDLIIREKASQKSDFACLLEWLLQKARKNLVRIWRNWNPVTAGRNVTWLNLHRKTVWISLRKWNRATIWSSILTYEYLPKELKSGSWLISHIYCSITTTKRWKQPKYSPTDEWRKWGTCIQWHTIQPQKGRRSSTCCNMDRPWEHYAEGNNPVRRTYTMWFHL